MVRMKPARWRKARWPKAGTRWATPMNRIIWQRDHGDDMELWRDTERLAVAYPDGSWWVDAGPGKPRHTGKAETQDDAKLQARNKLREIER